MVNKNALWAIGIIAVLLFAFDQGMLGGGSSSGDGPEIIVNPTPIGQTLTINMKNKHNLATTVTGDTIKTYIGGTLLADTTVSGGTVTVNPEAKLTIYGGDNSSAYYTFKHEMTASNLKQDTVQLELCAVDTGVTMAYFNENEAVNENITVDLGGSETAEIQWKAASDKCYGNPQIDKSAGVGVFYNTAVWSRVELGGADFVSCPSFLDGASNFVWKCYEIDHLEDGKNKVDGITRFFRNDITFVALSSMNPRTNNTHENVTVRTLDKTYDFHARTDAVIADFQDEDGNDLGDTTTQVDYLMFN